MSLATRAALLAAVFAVACEDAPVDQGRALGQAHVELVRSDALTVDRFHADLDEGFRRQPTPEARRAFREGYREAIRPVEREIAAMLVADAAEEAGAAVGEVLGVVGEGMGRALGAFLSGFDRALEAEDRTAREARFREAGRELSEALQNDETERNPDRRAQLRQAGQRLGRMLRSLETGIESLSEGIEEGYEAARERDTTGRRDTDEPRMPAQ